MLEVETILASLYAKEISASLEWKGDRGFHPGFGYPAMRKKWFRTSGEAVRWLKEQALVKHPNLEFPPKRNRIGIDAEAILDDLYASQIDGSIEWIWDGGFLASLGGPKSRTLVFGDGRRGDRVAERRGLSALPRDEVRAQIRLRAR